MGVKIIQACAFTCCTALQRVEFGDKLQTIEKSAFFYCRSLRSVTMSTVRTIECNAFGDCEQLTELELPEDLETLQGSAFKNCKRLRRIALPLKDDMIAVDVFHGCIKLATIDLVGGIYDTVASLHLESWRNELTDESNRINQELPTTQSNSITPEVQQWMRKVTSRLDHYKAEHKALLKESTTLLELALWKANLDDKEGDALERKGVGATRSLRNEARKESCVTSGASIVINNLLPFLQL